MAKAQIKSRFQQPTVIWKFPLQKENFLIIGLGIIVIIVGYLLMATGITEEPAIPNGKWNNVFAVSIAPILLVLGYCVIIPFGIFKSFPPKEQ